MISLDTNVIVRVVTADDPQQLAVAVETLKSDRLWLCKTVLLECEWVLRYTYKLSRESVLASFQRLLGYPNLQVEDRGAVLQALVLYREGLDFADAVHLASSLPAERFVTFDRGLATVADRANPVSLPAVELLSVSRR
ncbi:MAG TPA: type II toxin-antitoxin system VapC family toxin [Thermoanaerobaculia bacterium]|nr:type II toxin-antitoxin system VapC family toxin [Thermoanaerobaculia bacterium]